MKRGYLKVVSPLGVVVFGMILFGTLLRFWDLGYPERLTWDEHHFVHNARNYLQGRADWNDHPPLGKLVIALSMMVFDDQAFYFRLPAAVFGTLSLLWAGLLAQRVFQSVRVGFVAAAFLGVDGFLISYSRASLLDGVLTSCTLLCLYLMTLRQAWSLLLAGVFIGSAMAVKMSAFTLMGPLAALALVQTAALTPLGRRLFDGTELFGRPLRATRQEWFGYVPAAALAILVYLAWWRVGLGLTHKESTWGAALSATKTMMDHHAGLTEWTHPLLSRWWTWAIPMKPIELSRDDLGFGQLRVMTTMGNPLLWWSVVFAFLYTLTHGASDVVQKKPGALSPLWLAIAFLGYLTPWILTNRDSYIYHYLPSYGIGLVLLAGFLERFLNRQRLLYAMCAVLVISAFYAPVWAKRPITEQAYGWRLLVR